MKAELAILLAQAEEKLLLQGRAWGDASSRAYYAAFHTVSAALLSKEETYSSHAQVLGRFNKAFVHQGDFPCLNIRRFERSPSSSVPVP